MDRGDKAVDLSNLINSCLMPELMVDVGEEHIASGDFNDFRKILDKNLVVVFDIVQAHEDLLIEDDSDFSELQMRFILLLCEQSSPFSHQWHQTKNQKFLHNITQLIDKYFKKVLSLKRVEKEIFNYYKNKLNAASWKSNVGAAIGFPQYLNLKYDKYGAEITNDAVTLMLSIGLLFQDFFDPDFKEIGNKIFKIILMKTDKNYLIKMNIQNVIFEESKRECYKFHSCGSVEALWDNLIQCLKINNSYTFEKFTDVDYLIKDLCHQIVIARSFEIWITLMKILIKIFLEFSLNTGKVKSMVIGREETFMENIYDTREKCRHIDPGIAYRWAKTISECLLAVSNYLMGTNIVSNYLMGISNRTLQALNIFHLCYLVWILPMKINICDDLLENFFQKFSVVLVEAVRLNKQDLIFCDSVNEFFKTFIYHIKSEDKHISDDSKMNKYLVTFEEIILYINKKQYM